MIPAHCCLPQYLNSSTCCHVSSWNMRNLAMTFNCCMASFHRLWDGGETTASPASRESDIPSGHLTSLQHTPTGSKTQTPKHDGPPQQHAVEYGHHYACMTNHGNQTHRQQHHKYKYVLHQWEHQDVTQELSTDSSSSLVPKARGWHSNVHCTPIFVLGQGARSS